MGEEFKYHVGNGVEMTLSQVHDIEPSERTILQWRIIVDWILVKQRPFVIVNPMDPSGLLYLTQKEYLAQAKVCASTDLPFITVVQPGIKQPLPTTSSSQSPPKKSPRNWGSPLGHKNASRNSREAEAAWKRFMNLRTKIHSLVSKLLRDDKMVSESSETISQTMHVWAQHLAHYAEVRKPGTVPLILNPFIAHVASILRHRGQTGAVQLLKVSLFSLYSYVSGNPLKTTWNLGAPMRLANGLPHAWGRELRDRIRSGDLIWVRLLASLLNIYRAMDAPHKAANVETIRQQHPDFRENGTFEEFKIFCDKVLPGLLARECGCDLTFRYSTGLGLVINKAGANVTGPAMAGIVLDAQAWSGLAINHPKEWFGMNGDYEAYRLMELIQTEMHWGLNHEVEFATNTVGGLEQEIADPGDIVAAHLWWATRGPFSSLESISPTLESQLRDIPTDGTVPLITGRLHAIDEPAGKVRVVAICDYWTQVALKPVHDHLFKILRGLSTDATFDQSGRVNEYFEKNLSPHWSFDLKSATDLIPIALYIEVMTQVLKAPKETKVHARRRAEQWASLLTDRDFLLPDKSGFIRYGTGQPMGALSSWASMALVHHALVQFSAWRAGANEGVILLSRKSSWFGTYLVLGDDVDISKSHLVASEYQSTCAELAIPIGLLKSLQSNENCFEFANRRFCPDGDISPLSLKEELSSTSWNSRLEYAKRILARFGSRYTNLGLALLRKAVTPQQWSALIPDSSAQNALVTGNLRNDLYARTVQFILENPFSSKATLERLTVDQLIKWVSILPMDGQSEATLERSEPHMIAMFQGTFIREVVTFIKESLDSRKEDFDPSYFGSVPTVPAEIGVAVEGHNEIVTKALLRTKHVFDVLGTSDSKRMMFFLNRAIYYPQSPGKAWRLAGRYLRSLASGPGSWNSLVAVHYVHVSILYRNMKTIAAFEEIYSLLTEVINLLDHPEEFREFHFVTPDYFTDTAWERAMEALTLFLGLPMIIKPEFDKPIGEWLTTESDTDKSPFLSHGDFLSDKLAFKAKILRDLEENLRGPYVALGKSLASIGVFLPSIPQMTFQSTGIKRSRWHTTIQKAAQKYWDSSLSTLPIIEEYANALAKGTLRSLRLLHGRWCSDVELPAYGGAAEQQVVGVRSILLEYWERGWPKRPPSDLGSFPIEREGA